MKNKILLGGCVSVLLLAACTEQMNYNEYNIYDKDYITLNFNNVGGFLTDIYNTVEYASRLLGIDQVEVDAARLLNGFEYGVFGNFMEDDASGMFRFQFQHFVQMPGNGLSFAVLIGSQPDGFCLLCLFFQLCNERLLIRRYLIVWFKTVIDIYTEVFLLQVAYVTIAGQHLEVFS